jgi:hypothetical protein
VQSPPVVASPYSREKIRDNHLTQQNFLFLHDQKFHPEMTKRYRFKEGKRLKDSEIEQVEVEKNEHESEVISPKSFVPIMVLGKGSFGEVYLGKLQHFI